MTRGGIISAPVSVSVVFATGLTTSVFAALFSQEIALARSSYSIWPCLALGAWATVLAIGRAPRIRDSAWLLWWSAGLASYLVHLWFAFGGTYGWSLEAVWYGQGPLVATANFALLALWSASVISAVLRQDSTWLHGASHVLFAITTLTSTVVFAEGWAFYGGVAIALAWAVAIYLRCIGPIRSGDSRGSR